MSGLIRIWWGRGTFPGSRRAGGGDDPCGGRARRPGVRKAGSGSLGKFPGSALCSVEAGSGDHRRFRAWRGELLETFADEAVIAIENVRLFEVGQSRNRDLGEALQQQTATSEVLKVLSRSAFDLPNVLQTLIELAARLSGGNEGTLWLRKGDRFVAEGFYNEFEGWRRAMQGKAQPISADFIFGRVATSGDVVHVPDIDADALQLRHIHSMLGGYRAALGVPLLHNGEVEGVFVAPAAGTRPFSNRQIELVEHLPTRR